MQAKNIGFGIEIECTIPQSYQRELQPGAYHVGCPSPVLPIGWNVQSDSSVQSPAGFFSAEVVSPVLNGEDGLAQVVQVLDYLSAIGGQVNTSCGLHVHVSIAELDELHVRRVINAFKKYELAFFALCGTEITHRLGNSYCKPSSRWDFGRYNSLNLQHRRDVQPHLEVRVFNGNLTPEIVVGAIYMTVALIARCSRSLVRETVSAQNPYQLMKDFIRNFMTEKRNRIFPEHDDHLDLLAWMLYQAKRAQLALGAH